MSDLLSGMFIVEGVPVCPSYDERTITTPWTHGWFAGDIFYGLRGVMELSGSAKSGLCPLFCSASGEGLHMFFGQMRLASRDSPVSSRLLRLARIIGQPFETTWIVFDSGFSISWDERELERLAPAVRVRKSDVNLPRP
jgi:hypothetical protein